MTYVDMEQKIALSSPRGIESSGRFSTPLMFAPAMIPVSAGKMTLNTDLNDESGEYFG